MLLHIAQHHLFLLNRCEAYLAGIGGLVSHCLLAETREGPFAEAEFSSGYFASGFGVQSCNASALGWASANRSRCSITAGPWRSVLSVLACNASLSASTGTGLSVPALWSPPFKDVVPDLAAGSRWPGWHCIE